MGAAANVGTLSLKSRPEPTAEFTERPITSEYPTMGSMPPLSRRSAVALVWGEGGALTADRASYGGNDCTSTVQLERSDPCLATAARALVSEEKPDG
jgi:hypothetical protein